MQLMSRHRSPHWLLVLGLAACLLSVVVVGTVIGVYKTDLHLTARVVDAAEIGGPQLSAHVDGRDAYLTGQGTESDLAHAIALASGIPGLRNVHAEVGIVAARTDLVVDPEAGEPAVTVVFDRGRITLRGLVADDGSRDTILAAAEAAVGASLVRDRLQEFRGVKPVEWTQMIPAAIGAAAGLPDVTLAFGEGRTLVTGAVATAEIKARVAAALLVAGVTAEVDSIRVIAPQEPWLQMERTNDEIVLTGLIGREDLDGVLAALEAVYGDLTVTRDALLLAGNSAEVDWPRQLASLIPSTAALLPWHLQGAGSGLALFGVSADPMAPARIAAVAARLDPSPAVEVRLTPAAVVGQVAAMATGVEWFDGRSDSLQPDAKLLLDDVVDVLFANPEITLMIEARSVPRRDLERVRQSGVERAAAVRSYLVGKGLDPMRIVAIGSSEATEDPAAAVVFVPGSPRSGP